MREIEERDRVADLNLLADHILRNLFTWTLLADCGVDLGFAEGVPLESRRSYSSAAEVLAVLGLGADWPEEDWPEEADWPEEDWPPAALEQYATELWMDVGAVLRARGGPRPQPPKPPRPAWADMVSADRALGLSIPDDLLEVVREPEGGPPVEVLRELYLHLVETSEFVHKGNWRVPGGVIRFQVGIDRREVVQPPPRPEVRFVEVPVAVTPLDWKSAEDEVERLLAPPKVASSAGEHP